jgi:Zn-dependent protease
MTEQSKKEPGRSRESGFRLVTLFGIEIRLDFSVTFIFALIVYSLGSGLFPDWHPDWSPLTSWSTALLAGLLFFASLLAHELSHSLVARRYGIRVPRITLFLFGGMAEIESEAETPSAEFSIAIAGPIMSLALSFIFSLLAASLVGGAQLESLLEDPDAGAAALTPLASACVWLSSVNLMLAIFNMIPGFPLDGGRVFRALVWRFTGDRLRATRYAAETGKWFGWLLMAFGLWNLLVLKSSGGLWLILIGWFLSHLAVASYSQTLTTGLLQPLKVSDLMRTHFERVAAATSLEDFAENWLLRSNQVLWPVYDQTGKTLGVISLADVIALDRAARSRLGVVDVMTPLEQLRALRSDDAAVDASVLLAEAGDQPLAVLQGEDVVGLIRGSDVLRWIMLHDESRSRH